MAEESRVKLAPEVTGHIEVYVNGVPQREGVDFVRRGDELVFRRRLAKEGRLGFWRWLSLLLGVAGTYRQNDSVDVVWDAGGRRRVETGLPILPSEPIEPSGRSA